MKKKLIEVALPLEAINVASVRENYIYKGNPSAIHKWWAQRPLAACRAVIFASLVDDPTSLPHEFPTEEAQEVERQRLFRIIERLVQWESNNDPEVLAEARTEIYKSTDGNPPPFLDPFCGGGSIPLEAQRLGLEAHGSDLNPIPVLITKALIEIPPKFKGQPPINPDARQRGASSGTWTEATGLAQDVRHYGKLLRDMAEQTLRKAYPMATLPKDYGGGQASVIAWIWARTVKCPNPACGITMPLVRSFMVSTKAGNPVRVDPIVDEATHQVNFKVVTGAGKAHIGTVGRRGATCVRCSAPASLEYIRSEGKARRIGSRLMASVVEAQGKRLYLSPSQEQETAALQEEPSWFPDADLPEQSLGFRVQGYGMTRWSDLFSSRQLLTMSTLIDLVNEVRSIVIQDAIAAEHSNAEEYANAVSTYLSFACTKYSI